MTNQIHLKKAKPYAVKSPGGTVIKDIDLSRRIVTGLFSTSLVFDSDSDVLLKGSTTKSIQERGPESSAVQKIKHLLFHDWERFPGKIQVLDERDVEIGGKKLFGVYFESKMTPTQDGTDTLINYQEEVYDNHSIGYIYLDGQWIDEEAEDWQKYLDMLVNPEDAAAAGFMYVWKEIKLFEGSTVAFGANALTPYLGVKSGNKDALQMKLNEKIGLLSKQLKSGQQSDDMMQKMEMQLLQLNEIVNELFIQEPDVKSTLEKGRKDTDTHKGLNVNQLLNVF